MADNTKIPDETAAKLPYNVALGSTSAVARSSTDPETQADKPPRLQPADQPSIGLALGGGGARGLAHLLMLEVFDDMGLRPKVMAGTSIGAIFGAAYASGLTAAQIRAHTEEVLSLRVDLLRQIFAARNEPIQKILSIFQLRSALLNPEKLLENVMPPQLANDFAELEIPLKIIAADFFTQSQVTMAKGPLKTAVAASMALPALFAPVVSEDKALLDGGLVNPLPFDVIANDADVIVAIDVSGAGHLPREGQAPSAFHAIVSSLQIMQESIVREKLRSRQPDILIEVDVGDFHVLEFHKLDKVLESARPAKAQLREKLERVLSVQTLPTLDRPDGSASAANTNQDAPKESSLVKKFKGLRMKKSQSGESSSTDNDAQLRPRLAERILKSNRR